MNAALLQKEARALLPAWGVCVLLVVAGGRWDREVAAVGFLLGSLVLGAQVFGHEYTYRTLPMLLTQPVARGRVYATKLALLAFALGTLSVAAYFGLLRDARDLPASPLAVVAVVALTAFTLGPLMTFLGRGPIPGTLFSGSIIGIVTVIGGVIGLWWYGLAAAGAVDRFQSRFFWSAMPVAWVAGALGSWLLFRRLQAIEGPGREINPAAWFQSHRTSAVDAAVTRRHPVRRLIAKELHLQQLVFAVAALYVTIAALLVVRQYLNPLASSWAFAPVTFMYCSGLAVLLGAMAVAEERHLGMLPSQLLLPVPVWQQWAVKVGVVFGLSVLLAMALPAAVIYLLRDPRNLFFSSRDVLPLATTVILMVASSLYVSTVATSGIRALTFAVPFLMGGVMVGQFAMTVIWWYLPWHPGRLLRFAFRRQEIDILTTAVAVLFVMLLLRLGLRNYRSSDISFRRTAKQLAVLAAAAFVLAFGLELARRPW